MYDNVARLFCLRLSNEWSRYSLYVSVLVTGEPLGPGLAMTAGIRRVKESCACLTGRAVVASAYRAGSSFLVLIHSRLPLTWIRGVREKLGNDDVLSAR
jgi:hypothetical protein